MTNELKNFVEDNDLSMLEYWLWVVRKATYVGLVMSCLFGLLVIALEMALPTSRDLIFYGLFGLMNFLGVLLIIPSVTYLESKYPEWFRRKK